jgi:hypothetical protein
MMAAALPADAVIGFLAGLRSALAGFVAELERQLDGVGPGRPYARLAVEHGLAVHRASLAWAERAIAELAGSSEAGVGAA